MIWGNKKWKLGKDSEFKKILKKARLEIIESSNELLIKKRFTLFNKFDAGILLYGIIGIAFIYISLNSVSSSILMLILIVGGFFIIGLSLLSYSFFSILFQITNFVSISKNEIKVRHNLKIRNLKLNPLMKIKIKRSNLFVKMGYGYGFGSYFRITEIFLKL